MLRIVIFSYDRAMQLDALLSSLFGRFNTNTFDIVILYNTSGDFYEEGYNLLRNRYASCKISFFKEGRRNYTYIHMLLRPGNAYHFFKYKYLRDHKTDFKELLEHLIHDHNVNFIMFLTDDGYFYRDTNITPNIYEIINDDPENSSFSTRLGKNIVTIPKRARQCGSYFTWDYYDTESLQDWSYPFSVDGVIYSSHFIYSVMKKILYINPNTFEGFLVGYVKRNRLLHRGFCYEKSTFVNLPLNKVQTLYCSESLEISKELLNRRFLAGYTLNYEFETEAHLPHIYPKRLLLQKGAQTEDILIDRNTLVSTAENLP